MPGGQQPVMIKKYPNAQNRSFVTDVKAFNQRKIFFQACLQEFKIS